ncbi:class II aldolase/adducin family protein [Agrobacterium vitis]|uniref:class II aldolase/adducin family protein n=1 Tax=Agrobacterium vitis TaxID=373 RepID=UPI0012E7F938|nr:class II aldolase/adducin family protein [Agrobacterium vitis]MVA25686.1 hypothetical protein [Agrobacterium vitis]
MLGSHVQQEIVELMRYADLVSKKGYVCNQLGNIALRSKKQDELAESLILTKHKGISLEEMTRDNIIAIGLESNRLYLGDVLPSIGHALNREIFLCRPDVMAVIHVHADELIAYFSLFYQRRFRFISADAAAILGAPVEIFPPELNVEVDAAQASAAIMRTNTLILANHGITTYGASLSQAYHRLNSMVAEVRRIMMATELAHLASASVNYLNDSEEQELYELAKRI